LSDTIENWRWTNRSCITVVRRDKWNQRLPGACNRSPGSKQLYVFPNVNLTLDGLVQTWYFFLYRKRNPQWLPQQDLIFNVRPYGYEKMNKSFFFETAKIICQFIRMITKWAIQAFVSHLLHLQSDCHLIDYIWKLM
jgi:hypothetical protein